MSIVLGIANTLDKVALRELSNCSRNLFPVANDVDTQHYNAHIKERNARSSEALAITEQLNPLMQLRAHIFRGTFSEAKKIIEQIVNDGNFEQNKSVATEVTLEQARLKAFEGAYSECVEFATLALSMNPTAVSKSTLYQIRALAFYELGQFQESLRDLDIVDSLESLLPFASSSFYSKILRIKIIAICQNPDQARKSLDLLWMQKNPQLNDPDILLTLVRAEVDIRKHTQEPTYEWTVASYKLAYHMGDRLYAALARLDMACASTVSNLDDFIKTEALEFKKIATLKEEVLGRSELISTSMQGWLNYRDEALESQICLQSSDIYESLVILTKKLAISFYPFQVVDLQKKPNLLKAITVLANGPVDKEAFFQQVWQMSNYHAHLHDNLVRTTLSNIRKTLKLDVKSSDSVISLPSTLMVRL